MTIVKFKDLKESFLNIIIDRHYKYWSKISPTMNLEDTINKFKNIYSVNDEIPFGIAMFDNDNLIGF